MQVPDFTAKNTASTEADPAAVIQSLQSALEVAQGEVTALKQQLDWFKRQLFGRKSEKRLIDNPDQLDLSTWKRGRFPLTSRAVTKLMAPTAQR